MDEEAGTSAYIWKIFSCANGYSINSTIEA